MKIGIAGVGGIGSNIAVNLVRSGINSLTIVDFDLVEPSNLNRQFYFIDQVGQQKVEALAVNLRRINPHLEIESCLQRLTAENIATMFHGCGVIVEGFDKQADKKMLLEHFGPIGIPVVSANGIAGSVLGAIGSRKVGNCHIFGDFTTDCHNARLYSHKVLTVAAHMTEQLLKHIDNRGKNDE